MAFGGAAVAASTLTALPLGANAQEVPSYSINVDETPYNAIGDGDRGKKDQNTAAFQGALNDANTQDGGIDFLKM